MINVSVIVIFIVTIIILIVSPHHGDQLEAKAIKVAKSMLENKQLLLTLVGGWWIFLTLGIFNTVKHWLVANIELQKPQSNLIYYVWPTTKFHNLLCLNNHHHHGHHKYHHDLDHHSQDNDHLQDNWWSMIEIPFQFVRLLVLRSASSRESESEEEVDAPQRGDGDGDGCSSKVNCEI